VEGGVGKGEPGCVDVIESVHGGDDGLGELVSPQGGEEEADDMGLGDCNNEMLAWVLCEGDGV